MTNETEKTGQELMRDALNQLIADPTAKINKNRVAKLAGLTHTLLTKKSYKDIKEDIDAAEETRNAELINASKDEQISILEAKLEAANRKLKQQAEEKHKPSSKTIKETEGKMMARLVEMYRYNDLLRTQLIEKHGTDIDEETGEILTVDFGKRIK